MRLCGLRLLFSEGVCGAGTIRHAQLAAIKHNREVVARYRALVQTPGGFEAYLETSTTEIEALRD